MNQPAPTGRRLVEAVADKDHEALRGLLDRSVDFRAMTPDHFWQATSSEEVLSTLSIWFGDGDLVRGIEQCVCGGFADVEHVDYRLRVDSEGGSFLVGQQAYLRVRDGRITWLRIMCAGYRAIEPSAIPSDEGDPT